MKKIKLLIILVLVIILLIIILMTLNKEKVVLDKQEFENEIQDEIIIDNEIKLEINPNMFYTINNCVDTYLQCIANKNYNGVYNLLDSEYIINNDITENNIIEKLKDTYSSILLFTQEIYWIRNETNAEYYFYGQMEVNAEDEKQKLLEVYMLVKLDYMNSTFSVTPITSDEYANIKYENIVDIGKKEIAENNYNKYKIDNITVKELINEYIKDYNKKIKYNIEEAYNLLDKEYRDENFATIDNYKEYLEAKKYNTDIIDITDYDIQIQEDKIKYTFKNNNFYCTIVATSVMKYTIILK